MARRTRRDENDKPKGNEPATPSKSAHDEGRELFSQWMDSWGATRDSYVEAAKFAWKKGGQWPQDILTQRNLAKRPSLEINQMPAYLRQVMNDQRQNRPAIVIRPEGDGATQDLAELRGDIIRGVEKESNAAAAYDTAFECLVTGGMGAWRLLTEWADDTSFDQRYRIKRIVNPLTVVMDPFCVEADFSDARGGFVYEEIPRSQFLRENPGADPVDFNANDQRGLYKHWATEKTVVVAEWYQVVKKKRTLLLIPAMDQSPERVVFEDTLTAPMLNLVKAMGELVRRRTAETTSVVWRKMTGAGIIDERPTVFANVPLILVVGDEFNVEGDRLVQGLTQRGMDPQRMYNFWATSATEVVALSPRMPFVGYEGQFTDPKWKTINTNNHAYVEVKPIPTGSGAAMPLPQRQAIDSGAAGILQMAQAARLDLQSALGLYDASLGRKSNETSGRAILAREAQGDTGTFHYNDNLARGIRYTGKLINDSLDKVIDTEREVSRLGIDGEEKRERVNQPGANAVQRVNDMRQGRFGVFVDVGPSYATKRTQAVEAMTELIRAVPAALQFIADLYVKNMDFPGARGIADRLKFMLPAAVQMAEAAKDPKLAAAIAPMQQQIQQLTAQLQQVGQQAQALATENQGLKAKNAANEAGARATIAKAEADVEKTHVQTAAIADKSAAEREQSVVDLGIKIATLLAQFIKLEQASAAPLAAEAASAAPVAAGALATGEAAAGTVQ